MMNLLKLEWDHNLITSLWVAVKTPKEGYIVVFRDLDRGWYPEAKVNHILY